MRKAGGRGIENCYVDTEHNAIADLMPYRNGKLLTRINVPREHRGRGLASTLLKRITADADRTATTLYTWVSPSDGLGREALSAWYRRNGFRVMQGLCMTRKPCTSR